MAFEPVTVENENTGLYWKPVTEGEYVEGNVCGFHENSYDEEHPQIVLQKEDGSEVVLPGNYQMKKYSNKVKVGEYLRCTFKGEAEGRDGRNGMKLFKLERDPERYIEPPEQFVD